MKPTNLAVAALAALALGCGSTDETPEGKGTVIGRTSVEIDSRIVTTRVGEAGLGNWLADALLAEARAAGQTVDIAFVNAGAIRGGTVNASFQFESDEARLGKLYPPGDLTDLDVAGWQPFNNDHRVVRLTGTQLKSVLERSVADLPVDLRADKGGWFLQVAGMRYAVSCDGTPQRLTAAADAVQTEGTRVTQIVVGSAVIYDSANSIDLLAGTEVTLVTNSFLLTGNDGHLAFKEAEALAELPVASFDLVKLLQDRVRATSPIAPAKDGRIAITGACGQPSTLP